MNQFRVFLRMEKKPTIAWALGTAAYVGLMSLMYVSLGGGDGLSELAESYPEEILDALGASDFTSVDGWMSSQFGSFAPVVFGIFLIMFMTKHLAGAEESGVIDHVLARPVGRGTYYWHLVAAACTAYGVILGAAAALGIIGLSGEAAGQDLLGIAGLMADLIPYGLLFIGLGGLLGAAFHRRGRANALGAGIVVMGFALDIASRTVDGMDWLGFVTPIGWLGKSDLANGAIDLGYVAFSLVVAGLTAFAGWRIFERKNLHS